MVLGADTGFFIAWVQGQSRAVSVWDGLIQGEHRLIVSSISLNELLVYFFRRGLGAKRQELISLMLSARSQIS